MKNSTTYISSIPASCEKNINQSLNKDIYKDELLSILSGSEPDFDINYICDLLVKRHSTDISFLSWEEQASFLQSRALQVLPEDILGARLMDSKNNNIPLSVKFWIDPTGSNVHLWHAVPMVMLNRLQRMGHKINLVIWDFTAKIGDPTGRSSERPPLTDEQIQKNLSTYKDQISPFFNTSKANIFYNSEWLRQLTLNELIETLSSVSVSKVLQRDDFRKRLNAQQGLSMSEMIYPIVMGIDSVELKNREGCDIELWGKDQFLNMQMCRTLMENHKQPPEVIISTDILEGITWSGLKMSKSLNNYIALNDNPSDIFWKIMSIPDSLLETYYKSLTEISNTEWNKIKDAMNNGLLNPKNVKKVLANVIVTIIYNKDIAKDSQLVFDNTFWKWKDYRTLDIGTHLMGQDMSLINFLPDILQISKTEVRRLAESWAITVFLEDWSCVKLNKASVYDNLRVSFMWSSTLIVKIGKKRFVKIKKEF